MSNANNPEFDKEELEILNSIVPEPEPSAGETAQASTDQTANADATGQAAAQQTSQPAAQAADQQATDQGKPADDKTTDQPHGDLRGALRASRRAEKRKDAEIERLKKELEDTKAGKTPVDTDITDAELAELEEVHPAVAKAARAARDVSQKLAQQAAGATPQKEEWQPLYYKPEDQMLIDAVPDLVTWQNDQASQDKFQKAIEFDKALIADPAWAARSTVERFAEAARLVKASLTTPAAAAATPRQDPAAVIANAKATGPQGISDFRGGAPANLNTVDYSRMSDEEVMASLPAG